MHLSYVFLALTHGYMVYKKHSHLQSFATPPPWVAVRRREVIRHADGRGWEKMENVEFRNFPNDITQILMHIKDYNIWNSFSLTDMRLLPQK